ncbi:ABC transporter permease subunit [Actinophytocola sp. NPDC049390]|uniref:ABC transporter permease subunit n=1 Tax=Actinophytocola sp. NPDC049390 TaxID=3363894 RepID=UPI00379D6C5D
MTWLTWRQFRIPAASVYAAVVAVCAFLAITGQNLVNRTDFSDMDVMYGGTSIMVYALPAVIGVFWGVPLVARELETGTHNLVWNQSITRGRWLTTKLGVGVVAAVIAAGLLSAAVSWWAGPIDAAAAQETEYFALTRMSPVFFAARGIAPVGYAAFAFVLGVAVGVLLRRTVAAMAVTLVVFTAVMVAVPLFVRPYVLPPVEETIAIEPSSIMGIKGNESGVIEEIVFPKPPGAWMLANETVDSTGTAVRPLPEVGDCLPPPASEDRLPDIAQIKACIGKLADLGYSQRVTYQPGSRFWPLQWLETGLFLALSALLAWFCYRRIRHV